MVEEVTRKLRVSLTRLVCKDFSPQFPISDDENVFPLVLGWYLSHGSFAPCFQEGKKRAECPYTC